MATVIEEEGKKVRLAISWISEMCQKHPEKKRSGFILQAEQKFNLSPREATFLLEKLSEIKK